MVRSNLRLLVFPVDDEGLRRDVEATVDRLPDDLSPSAAREMAQAELRRWYRSLSIRERDTLGGYPDDPAVVWYVYRDGRVRRQKPELDRLYRALAAARTTCETSEAAVERAQTAARAAGYVVKASRFRALEPTSAVRGDPDR